MVYKLDKKFIDKHHIIGFEGLITNASKGEVYLFFNIIYISSFYEILYKNKKVNNYFRLFHVNKLKYFEKNIKLKK